MILWVVNNCIHNRVHVKMIHVQSTSCIRSKFETPTTRQPITNYQHGLSQTNTRLSHVCCVSLTPTKEGFRVKTTLPHIIHSSTKTNLGCLYFYLILSFHNRTTRIYFKTSTEITKIFYIVLKRALGYRRPHAGLQGWSIRGWQSHIVNCPRSNIVRGF